MNTYLLIIIAMLISALGILSTYCFTTFMLHVLQKVKSRKCRFVIFIASFIVFLYVFLLLITSFLR